MPDADAPNVWIEIRLDEPIETSSEIRVRDDALGMTFDEANDLYLAVGRDRRVSGPTYTAGGRPVMAERGSGEARWVRRCSCGRSLDGEGRPSDGAFRMDYEQIVKGTDTPLVWDKLYVSRRLSI